MTAAIQPTKSLEERITSRLHDSIGDLITDDDLKGMVARGIEKALFERRDDPIASTTWNKVTKPSIVDQQVEILLAAKMDAAVQKWLAENPDSRTDGTRVRRGGCGCGATRWQCAVSALRGPMTSDPKEPEELVMIRDRFEMGPIITYELCRDTEEHTEWRHGYNAFRVPRSAWNAYEQTRDAHWEAEVVLSQYKHVIGKTLPPASPGEQP